MITQFAEHYRKDLREQMNVVADSLAEGGAGSFEEYRHMTGIIHGLAYAERALLDLVEGYEKGQDAN